MLFRSDIIGRTDLLTTEPFTVPFEGSLNLEKLLAPIDQVQRRSLRGQDDVLVNALDHKFRAEALSAAREGRDFVYQSEISNIDRTVGTMTGSALTRAGVVPSLRPGQVRLEFRGSAGQSLGAFVPHGMAIQVIGDANDYVGKGLSGGRIVVKPAIPDAANKIGRAHV